MSSGVGPVDDAVILNACSVNCEGRCVLRLHVENGAVSWVETDSGCPDDSYGNHQVRACLRGRSVKHLIEHPERLSYPLRRVGRRGEGKFERISWDQALDDIASELKRIVGSYGNEAVYINFASGVMSVNIAPFLERFMNLYGGHLGFYGDYSHSQIDAAMPYLYGIRDANSNSDIVNSKLLVLFGDNSCETKMCGAGGAYHLMQACEAGNAKVVVIDPRYSETAASRADQWIPLRPGTDGALAAALAYVMITEGMVDYGFLSKYCIGYDASSLPSGLASGSDYQSYILGAGADKIPKTPTWASGITGVPAETIIHLAREIASTKPCAIYQGKGPQRHANGEQTVRSIAMLAIITGNVGISGGNTGSDFGTYRFFEGELPVPENPVGIEIPCFCWTDAIDLGKAMTGRKHGVVGASNLPCGIKFLWNYAGNCIANQHSNINRTHEILQDETKCEFIVVIDIFRTASADYADIVLPDLTPFEQPNLITSDWAGNMAYVIANKNYLTSRYERKSLYWMLTQLSDRLGIRQQFTEGRSEEEWRRHIYQQACAKDPELPEYEALLDAGIYRRTDPDGHHIALADFRDDPLAHPLETPSGKIEIYSAAIMEAAALIDLSADEAIDPLPIYVPCFETDNTADYPLQLTGFHHRSRAHSSYANVPVLQKMIPQELWINPADAYERGIGDGDKLLVFNSYGKLVINAKVTPRIIPGVVAMGEGAWHKADMFGSQIDLGGCINTLTTHRPTPLSKGNPQHTNHVQVRRLNRIDSKS